MIANVKPWGKKSKLGVAGTVGLTILKVSAKKYMEYLAEKFSIFFIGIGHLKKLMKKYFAQRFYFEKTRFSCFQAMPSRTCVLRFVKAKTVCISRTR